MRRFALLLLLASGAAPAQDATAWVDCDGDAERLVVVFAPGDGAERHAGPADHEVVFYELLELDPDGKTVVATHDATIECRLGTETLTVVLSPVISNVNLLGVCGAAISGSVDVSRAGVKVVDALAFEDADCFARDEEFVARVTLRAGAAAAELERRGYDFRGRGIGVE
jgi:hypothetical protein